MTKDNKQNDECIKNYQEAKQFFKGELSISKMDKIFAHLLTCAECLKSYKFYCKAVRNEDFNIREQAVLFCNNHLDKKLKTRSILKKQGITGLYTFEHKFECIAQEFKLSKLKDVVAVSDLFLGDETIESIKNSDMLLEFTKHLTLKICKELDYLERCYAKGMGVLVNTEERG